MDFEKVVPLIIKEFEAAGIRYAAIGGFALGILGIMRSTVDLDLLVQAEDLSKIDGIMMKYQYRCVYRSENLSQFVSDLKIFGEIDLLHAFREASRKMLDHSQTVKLPGLKHGIRVLRPEDIIGLKVQAAANDPKRRMREFADIEAIIERFGNKLDWERIREYFSLFKMQKVLSEIKKKYGLSH